MHTDRKHAGDRIVRGLLATRRAATLVAASVLAAISYRGLAAGEASSMVDTDAWLFLPGRGLALPAVAVAAWLAWRRLRVVAITDPPQPGPTLGATLLVCGGLACFAWGLRAASPSLLLLSIGLYVFALGAWRAGRAGLRAVAPTAVVLLVGAPLPAPLEHAWVWHLQLWTARDVAWLLDCLGVTVSQAGVLLWNEHTTFQVIEGCSGLRGTRILLLVAIVTGWVVTPGRRALAVLLAALPVGYGLNVLRVAWIVVRERSESPAAAVAEGHVVQGMAVLVAGTAVLYGLARLLRTREPPEPVATAGPLVTRSPGSGRPGETARPFVALAALQCLMTVVLPSVSVSTLKSDTWIPDRAPRAAGWTSEAIVPSGQERFFHRGLPVGASLYVRYTSGRSPAERVDLLVVAERPSVRATGRWFSSRLHRPHSDARIVRADPLRLWGHGVTGVRAQTVRGFAPGSAELVHAWRLRDRGLLVESLAAVVDPLGRWRDGGPPRIAVRLATPIRGAGALAVDRAEKRLDRFVDALGGALVSAGPGG